MATKQQDVQAADLESHRQRHAAIVGHVLRALGQPGGTSGMRMDLRRLWECHYRINVLVGADAASCRVAQSYFLVTDSDGNILSSTPKIGG